MVQEVQQQGNWYQTPNRIAGIGISERKVNDHTQVRERWTNGCYATTTIRDMSGTEEKSSSWTITGDDDVKYKTIGGKIYIPLAGTYLVRFTLDNGYASAYTEIFRIYKGNREIYRYDTTLLDKDEHVIYLNLGRKDDISISLSVTTTPGDILTLYPKIQLIRL